MRHASGARLHVRRVVARAVMLAALTGSASDAKAAGLESSAPGGARGAPTRASAGIAFAEVTTAGVQDCAAGISKDPLSAHGAGRKEIKEVAACIAAGLALGATLVTVGGFVAIGVAIAAALIACL